LKVTLVNTFSSPFDNAVAAARTCYSAKGIVTPEQVAGAHLSDPKKRVRARERAHALAQSIYQAGHHTTLQHVHVQFALEGVSRQFIWSFLHSHPFYNSEQVSQRYVTVTPDQVYLPPSLNTEQRDIYLAAIARQMDDYQSLSEQLLPAVRDEYRKLFRSRTDKPRGVGDVQKKAQEVARYVLPVGTTAYMYHTVSLLTLMRYQRMSEHFDTPVEQRAVIGEMVAQVIARDPELGRLIEGPLPLEETPEYRHMARFAGTREANNDFLAEFDARLDGYTSKLVDWSGRGEAVLADAVREVLGLSRQKMDDDSAIAAVMDPAQNNYLGETMNLKAYSKLGRSMVHSHYSFAKKISHAADSQDQRHRMTPASRPIMAAHLGEQPDYITPLLIRQDDALLAAYSASMEQTWDDVATLKAAGADDESAHYLLPNALAIRFTESADLASLHHKMAMRLCYNSQEEIWQASVDEAEQVQQVHPRIGRWLLPPCTLRDRAGTRPICPEGERYCGVKVWRLDLADYQRLI
jgi:flavin-dependent thymidylate synthase